MTAPVPRPDDPAARWEALALALATQTVAGLDAGPGHSCRDYPQSKCYGCRAVESLVEDYRAIRAETLEAAARVATDYSQDVCALTIAARIRALQPPTKESNDGR